MSNGYEVGVVIRLTATFKDAGGSPVDPSTVTLRIRPPVGAVAQYVYGQNADLVRDSLGAFRFDVEANVSGRWKYRWVSTGTGAASKTGEFYINESDV